MLTKLYNCTLFNFILEVCSFMLHFILHFLKVFIGVVVVLLEKVRLISFYSQKWYTWWWNNCEMKELGTIYLYCNSFPWISLIKLWNHLANIPVDLVHSRAGLQSKTYSTYSTEDNRGSLLMKVLVQPFCGIWSGNKSLKYSVKLNSCFHNIIGGELLLTSGTNDFGVNLLFHMWNYKIAMATFHTSQYQHGNGNLKCHHGRKMSGH